MTDKSPEGSPFEAWAKLTAASMGPFGQVGMAWMEAMSDLGSEFLHLVWERVEQDVATQHKLLHSSSMEELRHAQAEFVQKAIDDYTAETGKIIEMNAELTRRLGLPKMD